MPHLLYRLTLLLLCVLSAISVAAQTRDSADLRGLVVDQSGAPIPGAVVTVTNSATRAARTFTTDSEGQFRVSALPLTGSYAVSVQKAGFESAARSDLQLQAGQTAALNFILNVAGGASTVVVYGTPDTVATDMAQQQTRFDLQNLEHTPVLGRKLSTLPLLNSAVRPARGTGDLFLGSTLFVVNGGGRRQTTFSVDNTTGDDSWGRQTLFTALPFSVVQEFTVITNAASSEYGRTTGNAVNIVTKSGTNAFHGDFTGLWRPSSIQASAPLATTHTGDKLLQGSGSISGPLVRDRVHFLVADEYSAQDRDSVITSALAPGIYTGHFRQNLAFGRLDWRVNDRHSLFARLNSDTLRDTNPADAVGGLNLPSAARVFRRRTYSAVLSHTATISRSLLNEARAQFQLGSPITQFTPVNPSPQFVRPGLATEGDSRSASLLNHQYEWADTLMWTAGKHSLKTGADVVYSSSGGFGQEFGGGFVQGQFQVKPGITKPVSQLTIADISRFTQSFGNLAYNVKEALAAGFVQDTFNATPRLALNLGLRYEYQTFTGDHNNFAPRVGFVYKLPFGSTDVVRGSYGVFYSEVRSNLAAGFEINGPTGIFSFSAAPGQFGFPATLAPLPAFPAGAVLPPRDITVNVGQREFLSQFLDVSRLRFYPDQLLNPYTQQWTAGWERSLTSTVVLSVDYVGQHSLRVERPADLNAPAPFVRTSPGQVRSAAAADATRPIVPAPNGFRRIVAIVNAGAARYDGLEVNLRKRFSNRFAGLLSYTWSHAINTVESDTPQQDPNDSNFLGREERATSLLDQRHRLSLSGWYQLPWRVSIGTWLTAASGRPFNATTGVDNNGDGSNSDRPVINGVVVPRNFGQGTPVYDWSLFVEKGIPLSERAVISLRAEGFNLTNHNNVVGRNGVYGNLTTGQPLAAFGTPLGGINNTDPGRQFQFLVRLGF